MSDREFEALRSLIGGESGIALAEAKRPLLVRRLLSRVRDLGLDSFGAYYEYVVGDRTGSALTEMLDLVSTNETHFFREWPHFEFLEQRLFRDWRQEAEAGTRERRIRVWSAACSTGQEPYSLAMHLLTHLPPGDGWKIEIMASDLSTRVLARAQAATWPIERASEIPEAYRKAFMLRGKGAQAGFMRASQQIRDVIRFERVNLHHEHYPIEGKFDLVFCRNVMIYFSPETRATVIERLTDRITPGGYLFVGHAESLHSHRTRLRPVVPTIYRYEP